MKMYEAIPIPTMRLTAVFAPLSIIMMMASGAAMLPRNRAEVKMIEGSTPELR